MKFHCRKGGIEIVGSSGDHHDVDVSYLEAFIGGTVKPLTNEGGDVIGLVVVPNEV